MNSKAVFGRYDLRGDYPGEVDTEFAERLGRAFGAHVQGEAGEKVLVCRDTKQSSENLERSLVDGLSDSGTDVLVAGVGPTDMAAFGASINGCHAVMVTSSHLPLHTNGFKLLYPGGNSFSNEDRQRVRIKFEQDEAGAGAEGAVDRFEELEDIYLERAEEFVRSRAGEISGTVTVDTCGGAGTNVLPELLERLGAKIEHLDSQLDPPDPVESPAARKEGKAVATDMDADRVAFSTGDGWIDGDTVFAALVDLLQPERVVASVDSSPAVERAGNADFTYTRVGDPFVLSAALEHGAELAGEPNGHFAFPDLVPYCSGTVASALLVAGEPGIGSLPDIETARRTMECTEPEGNLSSVKDGLAKVFTPLDRTDGIRLEVNGSRVLVRSSGTEPLIRLVAHAETAYKAEKALEQVEAELRKRL